jgi:hypothetical protein
MTMRRRASAAEQSAKKAVVPCALRHEMTLRGHGIV